MSTLSSQNYLIIQPGVVSDEPWSRSLKCRQCDCIFRFLPIEIKTGIDVCGSTTQYVVCPTDGCKNQVDLCINSNIYEKAYRYDSD